MTVTDRELVRQILGPQLKEVVLTRVSRDSILIHPAADPIDVTQQAEEREIAVLNMDRESTLARKLRAAIDRLNDDAYGVCLGYEEDIAPKRLKAIPSAESGIHCVRNRLTGRPARTLQAGSRIISAKRHSR